MSSGIKNADIKTFFFWYVYSDVLSHIKKLEWHQEAQVCLEINFSISILEI